jgi:hypothetical protein
MWVVALGVGVLAGCSGNDATGAWCDSVDRYLGFEMPDDTVKGIQEWHDAGRAVSEDAPDALREDVDIVMMVTDPSDFERPHARYVEALENVNAFVHESCEGQTLEFETAEGPPDPELCAKAIDRVVDAADDVLDRLDRDGASDLGTALAMFGDPDLSACGTGPEADRAWSEIVAHLDDEGAVRPAATKVIIDGMIGGLCAEDLKLTTEAKAACDSRK